MKIFTQFIVDAAANPKPVLVRTSSKIITLPNQTGTLKIVKSTTTEKEAVWNFEYKNFKGEIFTGEITQGWSRLGGSGYIVMKITDANGQVTTMLHGTHKTISAAVLHAASMVGYQKGKT